MSDAVQSRQMGMTSGGREARSYPFPASNRHAEVWLGRGDGVRSTGATMGTSGCGRRALTRGHCPPPPSPPPPRPTDTQLFTSYDGYGQHFAIIQYIEIKAVQDAIKHANRTKGERSSGGRQEIPYVFAAGRRAREVHKERTAMGCRACIWW